MVEIRNGDGDRFAARPDPAIRLALFHGPDTGLAAERAARFIAAAAPGAAVVRFDSDDVAADPRKLLDEAYGLSLFAERKAIRIRVQGNRPVVPALEPLIADPPPDAWVVVEAPEQRKTSPLRRLFEGARVAAAVACYPDDARALDRLIDDELSAHGLTAGAEARALLAAHLGADRLASRAELAKLALYVGAGEVGMDDVRAVIGDAADLDADDAVSAAAAGETAGVDRALRRHLATGAAATAVAGSALRHLQSLHAARAAIDGGTPLAAVLERRGLAFGPRRAAMERELRIWTAPQIARAMEAMQDAINAGRQRPAVEVALIRAALLRLSRVAGRAANR